MPITKPVAVVGLGAILPDAHDVASFWNQIKTGHYSITDVPQDRWDPELYYDPDPSAVDKTYSKIGAWVQGFKLEPHKMGIAIPPRVVAQMDEVQQWAIAAAYQALVDYGYPTRKLDLSRTAVILGNALGGEKQYLSTMRIRTPEFMRALQVVPEFQSLPTTVQQALLQGMRDNIRQSIADITEDTMPGELGNIIAGRVANVFNLQGANFVTDAACASSLAALQAAVEGLNNFQFDAVLTGGADRMMGVEGFVKFCKIGALSPDGSRPYADGANGFVMGEGTAVFLLKRLEDAENDGDAIYAVVRGIGSSSDGKGKGITAPNPIGQEQAIERAWKNVGVNPGTIGLIEGHGTSTRVGDVVEVSSLNTIFSQFGLPNGKIALGSVKSNIGHLKSAAGAAGMLKVVLALHEKVIPPSVNFHTPNPAIDFSHLPFAVNTRLRPWEVKKGEVRRAGISSFGFGGTNFHVVMDEYIPGILAAETPIYHGADLRTAAAPVQVEIPQPEPVPAGAGQNSIGDVHPYRGLYFVSADSQEGLKQALALHVEQVRRGEIQVSRLPEPEELTRLERLAIDYKDADELLKRAERALKGFEAEGNPWPALTAHGIFRGSGEPGKVAFLFPGQGSQYVNMLKDLCEVEPVVAETFAEADQIMTPILGRALTSFIYVDGDEAAVAEAEKALRNTEITQPAMLTANVALLRLMQKFGFEPDMVIGHSLGEYAGLVAAGVLTFAEALEVVSARGREMKKVSWDDNGCMAAVSAPIEQVENIIQSVTGYVVIANINSPLQCVIGGTTQGVDAALEAFQQAGYQGTKIPVSHAFHTRIVEPASGPLREVIARMGVKPPKTTIVANVTGEVYPQTREEIIDILARQVASPVQFIKGVETLQRLGGKVFVEIGPKRVLNALATDILKGRPGITILATNHPREGAVVSFNKALCGLFAAGVIPDRGSRTAAAEVPVDAEASAQIDDSEIRQFALQLVSEKTGYPPDMLDMELDLEADLGIDTVKQAELFATIRTHYQIPRREDLRLSDYNTLEKVVGFVRDALEQGSGRAALPAIVEAGTVTPIEMPVVSSPAEAHPAHIQPAVERGVSDGRLPLTGSVVISGAGLGLPGRSGSVFDDGNIQSILNGDIRIEAIPEITRQQMLDKRVTRLIKSESGAVMQAIDHLDQTVKLGGQRGAFDLADEFGVPADRVEATDISTQLAIAAGIEALRDAGIPLVMGYRQTSKGTFLPDRWRLPEPLADETGVIFGSAFPGLDEMAEESGRFYQYQSIDKQMDELRSVLAVVPASQADVRMLIEKRLVELREEQERLDYHFDRRFIFRILSMGHSQFAEYIGARGPNTHVNAACATTTHAVALAEDWIRTGRARRVIVVAGDDVTSGPLADWVGTGLMASGAATIEGDPRKAILPFDRRRNGMIMGMGAAALVVESEDALRERGMRGICEVLATQIANSAYHGTRLDTRHVGEVMERLLLQAEARYGLRREQIAGRTVFVSHETYTPARGGSASAEIRALRSVFGDQANQVVIANTKGYTGHTMGVGVEDVVAVKALEYRIVPPIANIHDGFEPDPELGDLRLSTGGHFDINFALRLGAGFGSQLAMTLMRKISGEGSRISGPVYEQWLAVISGYENADLVVEKRTLRVRHAGPPQKAPVKSRWQFGQGPTMWADETDEADAPQMVVGEKLNGSSTSTADLRVVIQKTEDEVEGLAVTEDSGVQEFVLQAVSEKTGYPIEMLDLDLDLEADLGIDTVKQAELFATIRGHFDIPRREDLRLSDYNTLTKVIGFMRDALREKAASSELPPVMSASSPAAGIEPLKQPSFEGIKDFVLLAVSEKTGYPVEMLDLDLDLEADLGIDTVKQAELFATIRTHYEIPRREDLRLSDYNNLSKVIGFMQDALKDKAKAIEKAHENGANMPDSGESVVENESVKAAIPSDLPDQNKEAGPAILRRIPVPALRPRLELCTPTGIEINHDSRIIVIGDRGKAGERLVRKLRGHKADVLLAAGSDPESMIQHALEFEQKGRVQGVYFLSGLDIEAPISEMTGETWKHEVGIRTEAVFRLMQSLESRPFLMCATRMGGQFGFGPNGANAPLGGGVSGFTKALAWERPQSLVKVVDFEANASIEQVAARLLAETLYDPGVVEVGWKDDLRFNSALVEKQTGEANFRLSKETVYVVSGGSAGITAPIVLDLARESGGRYYLLSRTALPDAADPDLIAIQSDRNAYKLQFAQALRQQGEKATPAAVDQKMASLERMAAMLQMMAKVNSSGAGVDYLVCDVTDPHSCDEAIKRIVADAGHVDVFIHAAGVERSRKLDTKPLEEFRDTVSVKADGFFNLFKAMEKENHLPKAVVFFSSLAGRFGNTGQTDYSAANDLLAKLSLALPVQYPGIKSLALDWGAWADVGMASRGYIPELMKRAGIDLLQPAQAAPLVRQELVCGPAGGEVLLAGGLGMLGQPIRQGGLDVEKANQAIQAGEAALPRRAEITGLSLDEGIVIETDLDPNTEPYLRDHALNGIPLLPGVMGIEGLSSASRHIAEVLASEKGGFKVTGLEDINFLLPFKFYRSQPRRAIWKAKVVVEGESLVALTRLESVLTRFGHNPEPMVHFTAKVCLERAPKTTALKAGHPVHWNGQKALPAAEIYKLYFHGPSFQVLEAVQRTGREVIGKLQAKLPPFTAQQQDLTTAPLLLELCMQTAGVWEIGQTGTLALPRSIGHLQVFHTGTNGTAVFAEVQPRQTEDGQMSFDARVVDAKGKLYLEMQDYRTSPLPYSIESDQLVPLQTWLSKTQE